MLAQNFRDSHRNFSPDSEVGLQDKRQIVDSSARVLRYLEAPNELERSRPGVSGSAAMQFPEPFGDGCI